MIIGLTGTIGSGKSTASDYLVNKHGFFRVIMGDLVREKTREDGLELTRENQQATQKKYRDKFGQDYFIEESIKRLLASNRKKLILDGFRTPTDAKVAKKYGAKLILLDAPPKIRFERLRKRGSLRDVKTFPEFQKQEKNEWRLFNFKETFRYADYKIDNTGTIEELYRKLDNLIKKLM